MLDLDLWIVFLSFLVTWFISLREYIDFFVSYRNNLKFDSDSLYHSRGTYKLTCLILTPKSQIYYSHPVIIRFALTVSLFLFHARTILNFIIRLYILNYGGWRTQNSEIQFQNCVILSRGNFVIFNFSGIFL